MGPGVNTLLTSPSMCNKCKFLLMILDSDLSNGWYVTNKGIPLYIYVYIYIIFI